MVKGFLIQSNISVTSICFSSSIVEPRRSCVWDSMLFLGLICSHSPKICALSVETANWRQTGGVSERRVSPAGDWWHLYYHSLNWLWIDRAYSENQSVEEKSDLLSHFGTPSLENDLISWDSKHTAEIDYSWLQFSFQQRSDSLPDALFPGYSLSTEEGAIVQHVSTVCALSSIHHICLLRECLN